MRYFELTGLRALFQTICFGFIGAVAIGSHVFGYPTSEIRDTGGVNKTIITANKESIDKTNTPDIAKSFKTTPGANYSTPVTTASVSSASKTIYFNQPVINTPTKATSGKFCTEYDAGSHILRCADYGGKFYYAHRIGAFAQLSQANIGDLIVVGGQTFRVASRLQQPIASINMHDVVVAGGHDASFMTCAGPADSERLIIYANRV